MFASLKVHNLKAVHNAGDSLYLLLLVHPSRPEHLVISTVGSTHFQVYREGEAKEIQGDLGR